MPLTTSLADRNMKHLIEKQVSFVEILRFTKSLVEANEDCFVFVWFAIVGDVSRFRLRCVRILFCFFI